MPGPAPKPTHLRMLAGNPSGKALNKREPKPVGDLHEAPEWLSEEQRLDWAYAISESPKGLLKRIDRDALVSWVVQNDLRRRAILALRMVDIDSEFPMLTKTPNGMYVQNSYIGIINRTTQLSLKAAAELGFSPASRSRISSSPDDEENDNPFARNGNN